jgi:Flp pilus assembly pilin Flp
MLKHPPGGRDFFARTQQATALVAFGLLTSLFSVATLGAIRALGTALRLVLD